mgnify:CR=1 FL=1
MNNLYDIRISKFWAIFWLVISIFLAFGNIAVGVLSLIIPAYYYDLSKNCKYSYDDEKLIIQYGIFNKVQTVIPLYRIINITVQANIFGFGYIKISDKERSLILKYVVNPRSEMDKLTDKWNNAKTQNIRNEVI